MGTIENEQMEQKKPSFFLRISSVAVFGFSIKEICTCARYNRNSIQIFYTHTIQKDKGHSCSYILYILSKKSAAASTENNGYIFTTVHAACADSLFIVFIFIYIYSTCACYYVLVIILYAHKTATIAQLQCGGQRRAKSILNLCP